MDFQKAFRTILQFEGKPTNDPLDPGGLTACGISSRAHPDLDIATIDCESDLVSLTYRAEYWDALDLDHAPEKMRLTLFDCAVNQGVNFAVKALQESLGLEADGILGNETKKALTFADLASVSERFAYIRFRRYYKNKNWKTYGGGWSQRLVRISIMSAFGGENEK